MQLLVNPPKTARRRKTRRTAAQRRATAKMIAANKRARRKKRGASSSSTRRRRRSPAASTARKPTTRKGTTMARKRRRSTTRRRRRNPAGSTAGVAKIRGFFAVPKLEPALWTGAGFVAAGILPRYVPGVPQNSTPMRLAVKTATAALAGGIVAKTVGRRQGQYVALGGACAVVAEVMASALSRAGVSGLGDVSTPGMPDLGAVYVPLNGHLGYDPDDAILADALEGTYLPIPA